MKIAGKKVQGVNEETIVIPRPDGDVVFIARSVSDYKQFDILCPEPKAKIRQLAGGKKQEIPDELAVASWAKKRYAWLVLESLKATPDLEWETVQAGDPETWINYEQELRDSGFNEPEIVLIIRGVLAANSMDEAKLEAARKRFLALREEAPSE